MTDETKSTTEGTDEKLPEKEAPQVEPEAKVKEPEGTKAGAEEAPKPKMFSEDELKQRIESAVAGHKGTVTKLKGDIEKIRKEHEELQRQAEEQSYASLLRSVQEQGGDVDVAKQVVERTRVIAQKERELAQKDADLQELAASLSEAGKAKSAHDLVKTYALAEDDIAELLKAESIVEMENKALKLVVDKSRSQERKSEAPPKGQTASTKGKDTSKLSDIEKLGLAAEGKL